MRRCSRCGHPAVDAVGSPQTSLFDVAPADPRATPAALAELRTGRVLCSACQRTDDLPGMVEAAAAERAQAVVELCDAAVDAQRAWVIPLDRGERSAANARLDKAREAAGGQTFDIGWSTIRTTLEAFPLPADSFDVDPADVDGSVDRGMRRYVEQRGSQWSRDRLRDQDARK